MKMEVQWARKKRANSLTVPPRVANLWGDVLRRCEDDVFEDGVLPGGHFTLVHASRYKSRCIKYHVASC